MMLEKIMIFLICSYSLNQKFLKIIKNLVIYMLEEWILGCDNCQACCPFNKNHDWSIGKDYPGLDALELILQPEYILKASDEEIIEKLIPKFCFHLTDKQIPLLRKSAKRAIEHK